MWRTIFLAVLMASASAIEFVPSSARAGAKPASDSKAEVMQAEEGRNQALQKGDADALATLYTDNLIYTNALGFTLTKEQHLADIRSRKLKLTAFRHSNVEVRMHGDAGFVTGISTSMVNFHGNVSDSPRKFLNVYVKEDGVWKCAVHMETAVAKQ